MVEGVWIAQNGDLTAPLRLREAIFGRGRDALDDEAQHLLVFQQGEPVAVARLWLRPDAFWADGIGVLPAARGLGYGDLLVRMLLFKALSHGARAVALIAPDSCAGFFERYGFQREANQNARDAAGVIMRVRAEDIALSHCGGCAGG